MVVGLSPSYLSLHQQSRLPKCISDHFIHKRNRRDIKRLCVQRTQILPPDHRDAASLRVFVLSDLHTDYSENMAWVKCLSTVRYKKDVLIVAGDVAETYKNFVLTMSLLKDRFHHVFFVPGNHDLWCRREGNKFLGSLEKLNALLDACRGLGVETSPRIVDDIGIIPLFSWYHESFDREKDIEGIRVPLLEMACKDFRACKWPGRLSSKDLSLALYFDAMNDKNSEPIKEIQRTCSQTITFSHFLPRESMHESRRFILQLFVTHLLSFPRTAVGVSPSYGDLTAHRGFLPECRREGKSYVQRRECYSTPTFPRS
ncbi:PREDICTED: uncharacterized protein LOC104591334 isoform X2 [Nelumbo nucifera]|uniref:Uncharacterized protein LOC104591334 isoform X2 n=1 Tax=Nelumbo nucifera TaxID=4432 RepID=A0A1U7ZBA5_NELNU|nr:PREDICTED: uncharacterized protein LOC104591334 isoform X2 [Nelumbo nucifera]